MKLISWMNHKSKPNTTDSLKSSSTTEDYAGFPHTTFGEQIQRHHADPAFGFTPSKHSHNTFKSFATHIEPNKMEGESFEELFHGFLAIGTLGLEPPLIAEPPTPTIPKAFEDMCVTENELKLINDKLEKLLEAEAETEDASNKASERSRHATITILSNNQTQVSNPEHHDKMATCPFQNYLFGSSIELSETGLQMKKEKTSLGELFNRNIFHEHLQAAPGDEEKQAKGRSPTHFMKKMLKRIHLAPSTCKAPYADHGNRALITIKLPKVLKFFRRRVHPEGLRAEKKLTKQNTKTVEKIFCKSGNQHERHDENTGLPPTEWDQESIKPFGATKEHWIKTDDECE